jgi:hypothetical protein
MHAFHLYMHSNDASIPYMHAINSCNPGSYRQPIGAWNTCVPHMHAFTCLPACLPACLVAAAPAATAAATAGRHAGRQTGRQADNPYMHATHLCMEYMRSTYACIHLLACVPVCLSACCSTSTNSCSSRQASRQAGKQACKPWPWPWSLVFIKDREALSFINRLEAISLVSFFTQTRRTFCLRIHSKNACIPFIYAFQWCIHSIHAYNQFMQSRITETTHLCMEYMHSTHACIPSVYTYMHSVYAYLFTNARIPFTHAFQWCTRSIIHAINSHNPKS